MRGLACAVAVGLLAVSTGCSLNQSSSTTAASGSRLAPATRALDAEVAMPAGFPADFPTYPRARLTAAASFASTGQVAWGMEWQSLDAQSRAVAFYTARLGQSDWTLTGTTSPDSDFAATFVRRSNKNAHGTVYVGRNATATTILVSLVYPA